MTDICSFSVLYIVEAGDAIPLNYGLDTTVTEALSLVSIAIMNMNMMSTSVRHGLTMAS